VKKKLITTTKGKGERKIYRLCPLPKEIRDPRVQGGMTIGGKKKGPTGTKLNKVERGEVKKAWFKKGSLPVGRPPRPVSRSSLW